MIIYTATVNTIMNTITMGIITIVALMLYLNNLLIIRVNLLL